MKRLLWVSVIVSLCAVISPTWADLYLDQYQEQYDGSMAGGAKQAQTFTAGLSGLLDHVEIVGNTNYSVPVVEIWNTNSAGAPSDTILGSVTPTSYGNGWNSIDLRSANINLTAGDMYALVLASSNWPTTGVFSWVEWDPDSYESGAHWFLSYPWSDWQLSTFSGGGDMAFRTYVATVPVPLPGAVLLGVLGLGVAGVKLRKFA